MKQYVILSGGDIINLSNNKEVNITIDDKKFILCSDECYENRNEKEENKEKEYFVEVWGGAFNEDANPSIEKDLNIKSGAYYFKTKEKKDKFIQIINDPKYKDQGLMVNIKYGYMTHKRTIFVPTFKYKEKEFVIHYDFGYEYSEKDALYMFEDGNNSCDCNRSLLIIKEYGKDSIEELSCGSEIEMIDYHFEYLD